jgi:hypothetical protein
MCGIAGIVHWDKRPVDVAMLCQRARFCGKNKASEFLFMNGSVDPGVDFGKTCLNRPHLPGLDC